MEVKKYDPFVIIKPKPRSKPKVRPKPKVKLEARGLALDIIYAKGFVNTNKK